MEFNVPVLSAAGEEEWVLARVDRREDTKVVRIEGSPFTSTVVRAWSQGAEIISSQPGQLREASPPLGHIGWVFPRGNGNATVEIRLKL